MTTFEGACQKFIGDEGKRSSRCSESSEAHNG